MKKHARQRIAVNKVRRSITPEMLRREWKDYVEYCIDSGIGNTRWSERQFGKMVIARAVKEMKRRRKG